VQAMEAMSVPRSAFRRRSHLASAMVRASARLCDFDFDIAMNLNVGPSDKLKVKTAKMGVPYLCCSVCLRTLLYICD
jgi:hypothetical protein